MTPSQENIPDNELGQTRVSVNDLQTCRQSVLALCGLDFINLSFHKEGAAYCAASFEFRGLKFEYRASKITPTKTGQFVTIWKRNSVGITAPLESSDDFDFVIISSRCGNQLGQFIFPKSTLAKHGVITHNDKEGKRGIRVYPSWDTTANKQAQKTQKWQLRYFVPACDLPNAFTQLALI